MRHAVHAELAIAGITLRHVYIPIIREPLTKVLGLLVLDRRADSNRVAPILIPGGVGVWQRRQRACQFGLPDCAHGGSDLGSCSDLMRPSAVRAGPELLLLLCVSAAWMVILAPNLLQPQACLCPLCVLPPLLCWQVP